MDHFKDKIAANPKVQFIGVFDRQAHTKRIEGEINPDILGALFWR